MLISNEEEELRNALTFTDSVIPERISADPEIVENGLARLVLSIVELIRRLLEKQALRRMDNGTVSEEEIERLGNALMKLEEKMEELKRVFGEAETTFNVISKLPRFAMRIARHSGRSAGSGGTTQP